MNEQEKFTEMVMMLAQNSESGDIALDEEITKFEDAIEESGFGEAYFGTAKTDWDRLEVARPEQIPYAYQKEGVKYYAEYYDGMQAPFTACKWCDDFGKLENLLKNTSDILYRKYKEVIK